MVNYTKQLFYPKLSYLIVGILFSTHNDIGPYAREKQYCDLIESKLIEAEIPYKREFPIANTKNTVDFLINSKIILEAKAKRIIIKDDYYQLQCYLQASRIKLGLLVNFRCKYIKPKRIVRIDKPEDLQSNN